jgi:hypothetical protein
MSGSRIGFALGAGIVVAGCANLAAVNSASGDLLEAADSWNAVASEFQASCARRNLMQTNPSDCANERRASASLKSADKVLAAYFKALQQASTTGNFSVDPGISDLTSAVEGLPGASAARLDAVSGLVSFLAGLATRGIEERTIKRLVGEGAPMAIAVLDVLVETAAPELNNRYADERRAIKLAFASYVQNSGTTVDWNALDCAHLSVRGLETGTAFLLAQAYCVKIQALELKSSALTNYEGSLQNAKQTLKSLEDGKDQLDAQAIAKQLGSNASALKKDLEAIKRAF